MTNEIVINATAGETRVGIVERNNFTELHIEREDERNVAATVAMGRVTRVLPGMQAAFVDIGLEKAAFLYAGDYYDPTSDPTGDGEPPRRGRQGRGRNGSYRQPPNIDTLLREGQEIVVQVAKEPIGTKGARLTSQISIAGRHLVVTPLSKRVGVSRRIESERERRRLREIVSRIRPPDLGFIIRTAGQDVTEADLEADVKYLTAVWNDIQLKKETARAPSNLYTELPLPLRVIRDFVNSQTKRIVIDDLKIYEEMNDFLTRFVADPKPLLEHYRGAAPIFDHFNIESSIDANLRKKIWLKSGGYLIVDQSEALTAIDVNTGRFVGKRDIEETVLRTNLEAVKEVAHQLRFRNIGGIIIIDLIDMESGENRDKVSRALQEALHQDKSKTNILKISELGLVEMTRKRTRENLVQQLCEPCAYCEGRGYVLSRESMAYKVLREIRTDLPRFCGRKIAIGVNPRVAEILLGRAHKACSELGQQLGFEIEIRGRPGLHQEQFEVTALDDGPPVSLPLQWLDKPAEATEEMPPSELESPEASASPEEAAIQEPGVEDTEDPSATLDALEIPTPEAADVADPIAEPAAEEIPAAESAEGEDPVSEPAAEEASAAEMLDLEEENPILPPPAEVKES
jgi:ribonuclease G